MSLESIQQLRKDLKIWESAFNIVHQRKPEKKDIAQAPQEIQDKYQLYFHKKKKMKQTATHDIDKKLIPADLRESQVTSEVWDTESQVTSEVWSTESQVTSEVWSTKSQVTSEVWGTEFNKTPNKESHARVKVNEKSTTRTSLEKLAAKLFPNFLNTQSPQTSRCRGVSPQTSRCREVSKKYADSLGPDTELTQGLFNQTSRTSSSVGENLEKNKTDSNNFFNEKSTSCSTTRCDDSGNKNNLYDDPNDDFVGKGELLKCAEKLMSFRAGGEATTYHQISSKPRLSFLSVNLSGQFKDRDISDHESQQMQLPAVSAYKTLKTVSDNCSETKQHIKTCPSIVQHCLLSHTTHTTGLSQNISSQNRQVGKDKNDRRSNNRNSFMSSPQNLASDQWQDDQGLDEQLDNKVDLLLDRNLQKSEQTKPITDVSQHTKPITDVSQQTKPITDVSQHTHQIYRNRNRKNVLSLEQRSHAESINETSVSTIETCAEVIVKTTRRKCSKSKAKISTTVSRSCKRTYDECCFSEKIVTNDGYTESLQKKKEKTSGQGKRKRTLDVLEDSGCSRHNMDVHVSEEQCQNLVDTEEQCQNLVDTEEQCQNLVDTEQCQNLVDTEQCQNLVDTEQCQNLVDTEEQCQNLVDTEESTVASSSKVLPKKASTRKNKSQSSLNENYVCLNMKRKGYRRKGAGMTGNQLRKKQWKAKMASRSKSFGSNKCFKCGQEGHWANKCKGQPVSRQEQNHVEGLPSENSQFPSLREAVLMSRGIRGNADMIRHSKKDDNDIIDIEATIIRERWDDVRPPVATSCLTDHITDAADIKEEMRKGLSLFGFSYFRPGQEDSICRVLQGLSTLLVLSTGSGKSLCYQLPAYLYAKHLGSLTLVISPLVSLMEDQITGLPPDVCGACLHSGMTPSQRETVISSLREGKVHFLLVSPEAIVERGGARQGSFPPPGKIPPIAFACIDEAHCLSEWSHNFRPSYLRLCKVLRKSYNVKCFLGLTATATKTTAEDVARHLGIEDTKSATIRGSVVPGNLILSASRDENKDEALINLLKGERFRSCKSILIYCSRRDHTERVATLIRTSMKTSVDLNDTYQPIASKKQQLSKTFDPKIWTAESYHAGLTAAKRRRVQTSFMTGKLRVVVATVAFGMGLDMANVRAVIHYNVAKSFESYVQEIGRAGRDGQLSHCHLFLDSQNKDLCELRRHTYGNSVDRITLKKFLTKVFKPCRCQEIYQKADVQLPAVEETILENQVLSIDNTSTEADHVICGGHERAISIQETVQSLDMREEGVSTLLSYLELHPENWVENLNHVYANCSIKCYRGPRQLLDVAKKCPPVAVAIARQKLEGKDFSDCSNLDFNVIDVCDSMGWDSGTVKRELLALQWNHSGSIDAHKTGVCVELSDLAFHYRSRGDLTPNKIDRILDFLHSRARQQETTELRNLHLLSQVLRSVSHKNYWMCTDDADVDRSQRLKEMIRKYFDNEDIDLMVTGTGGVITTCESQTDSSTMAQLCGDIRQFVSLYGQDHTLTGRVIARIFHGIGSPNFPPETWGRVRKFWRAYLNVDFNLVIAEATRVIVAMK